MIWAVVVQNEEPGSKRKHEERLKNCLGAVMIEQLIQAIHQQVETQNRLVTAIEQNNELIVQILQVNNAILESLSDEILYSPDEGAEVELKVAYLDDVKVSKQ